MTTADVAREGAEELSQDQLELAGQAVAAQQLQRLNAEGAARGASELERMVRKWEDEDAAVRKLMNNQQQMFAKMTAGAPVGPMVLEPHTPPPTDGQEPSTPDGIANRQAPASGSGLLLTPSLSMISASPNFRSSPAMRKSMDMLMARQAKIWEQVAGTLGTRVSVMLSSPPLKVPISSDDSAAIRAELPALPPISESADQLKSIYNNSTPNKARSMRELSRKKPRTLSSEKTPEDLGTGPSAPPASPVRQLAAVLSKQSTKDSPTQHSGSKTPHRQVKTTKKAKRQRAEEKPRAEWNGRLRPKSPELRLPLLGNPSSNRASQDTRVAGPVRTQSRRPDGADPNLEATQLENKWDEIRNLMVCLHDVQSCCMQCFVSSSSLTSSTLCLLYRMDCKMAGSQGRTLACVCHSLYPRYPSSTHREFKSCLDAKKIRRRPNGDEKLRPTGKRTRRQNRPDWPRWGTNVSGKQRQASACCASFDQEGKHRALSCTLHIVSTPVRLLRGHSADFARNMPIETTHAGPPYALANSWTAWWELLQNLTPLGGLVNACTSMLSAFYAPLPQARLPKFCGRQCLPHHHRTIPHYL